MKAEEKTPRTGVALMLVLLLGLAAATAQATITTAPTLISPADGAEEVAQPTAFVWTAVANASGYNLELYTDPELATPVLSLQPSSTTLIIPNLVHEVTYYWRVRGVNQSSDGPWSAVHQFTMGLNITPNQNNVLHVRGVACGTCSGVSWANPVQELADALRWAWIRRNDGLWDEDNPLQIWVSAVSGHSVHYSHYRVDDIGGSRYFCTQVAIDACRQNALVMVPNVQILGGFAGHETALDQRDWRANRVQLAGGNRYRTILAIGDLGVARLDGFEIVNSGRSDLDEQLIEVDGQTISSYYGGGIYSVGSSMQFANLILSGNEVLGGGAAAYLQGGSPSFENVVMVDNVSMVGSGGAMRVNGGSVSLRNGLIADNVSYGGDGGAIIANNADLSLTNVTLSANYAAGLGGALAGYAASFDLNNTLLWGNADIVGAEVFLDGGSQGSLEHGLIPSPTGAVIGDGDWSMTAVLHLDPQFVDAAAGNFRLQDQSPAIDAGSNNLYQLAGGVLGDDHDLDGNPRLGGSRIDLGGYEMPAALMDSIFSDRFQ